MTGKRTLRESPPHPVRLRVVQCWLWDAIPEVRCSAWMRSTDVFLLGRICGVQTFREIAISEAFRTVVAALVSLLC